MEAPNANRATPMRMGQRTARNDAISRTITTATSVPTGKRNTSSPCAKAQLGMKANSVSQNLARLFNMRPNVGVQARP